MKENVVYIILIIILLFILIISSTCWKSYFVNNYEGLSTCSTADGKYCSTTSSTPPRLSNPEINSKLKQLVQSYMQDKTLMDKGQRLSEAIARSEKDPNTDVMTPMNVVLTEANKIIDIISNLPNSK
jgi:hypothetical protein